MIWCIFFAISTMRWSSKQANWFSSNPHHLLKFCLGFVILLQIGVVPLYAFDLCFIIRFWQNRLLQTALVPMPQITHFLPVVRCACWSLNWLIIEPGGTASWCGPLMLILGRTSWEYAKSSVPAALVKSIRGTLLPEVIESSSRLDSNEELVCVTVIFFVRI